MQGLGSLTFNVAHGHRDKTSYTSQTKWNEMHSLRRRLPKSLFDALSQTSSSSSATHNTRILFTKRAFPSLNNSSSNNNLLPLGTLSSPWFAIQNRGAKVLGIDVRFGNVIQRKGRIYQVLKAQHTQHGRGGAHIQLELRDVDSGNKVIERFRTDEAIEKVYVEEKHFTFLYSEGDSVMIMEPDTFEQMEVSKDLFGKAAAYLTDDMKVSLQFYDGKPMSAAVPTRVTCTVTDAKSHNKGSTATPQYKKVTLDNGLTVLVPSFIETGDEIVISTTDDSYITRAKG